MSFIHKQINKKLMNTKYKQLEETILKETDMLIEKAKSQGEKALYNLFKSAILKKYKDQYDVDILQGEVKKETVDKSIDFIFEDVCVSFRILPNIKDPDKEDAIRHVKASLGFWKVMVTRMLTDRGINVV